TGTLNIQDGSVTQAVFKPEILKAFARSANASRDTPAVVCDVSIKTSKPISVTTPLLSTHADIDMHLQSSETAQQLWGTIALQGGELQFPYAALPIEKARMTFIPGYMFDPFIELHAQNRVNGYDVWLQIVGTLSNYQ